jgi:hypothetical protein
MRLADPHGAHRAFPLGPQGLHAAVVGAFRGGQVQVAAGVGGQDDAVLDRGLLEPVPVGQVPGQPVDVADNYDVDLLPLDRPDEVQEVVAADLLERRVAVVLEPRRNLPAAPGRVPLGVGELGRHRLRRVVGLAQPA